MPPARRDFYSQLNNELAPYVSCQVTSTVAGLHIGKFGLEPVLRIVGYKQPEDKLRWHMLNDADVQAFWRESHLDALQVPAPEWADCMCYALNKLYGKTITRYDAALTHEKIIGDLGNGLPVYTSMKYLENKNFAGKLSTVSGHIVLVVGVDGDKLIVNDPYKNHLTGDKDGFNNIYTPEDFSRHNKGYAIRYARA
jgi:hypothetical protein